MGPRANRDDDHFWDGVARGVLLVQRCAHCRRVEHPPTPMCRNCGSVQWDTMELSGKGEVHSWIVSHHPVGADDSPRIVALIELDDGVRMVSNLIGVDPSSVTNDMAVEVTFVDIDGVRLPQFRPAKIAR